MAFPTCPDCRTPQPVADDSRGYLCSTCYMEVRFGRCMKCGLKQALAKRWTSFTCSNCMTKVDVVPNLPYPEQVSAQGVSEIGQPWPKF